MLKFVKLFDLAIPRASAHSQTLDFFEPQEFFKSLVYGWTRDICLL